MPVDPTPILGAAGLALAGVGTLYALHHLRSEPQRRTVATLLFWREAQSPRRPRVLWSRHLTQRRTFAILATALLLLAAALVADPLSGADNANRQVVVVDAGEETGAADAAGVTLLDAESTAATRDLRRAGGTAGLVVAGPRPVTLLRPDEPAVLAGRALDTLVPIAGGSASLLALQGAADTLGTGPGRLHWYTARTALPAGLPAPVATRVVIHSIPAPPAVAITGVTFEPAPDGRPSGTLRARVVSTASAGIRMRVQGQDGRSVTEPVVFAATDRGGPAAGTVSVADWPADGKPVALRLLDVPPPRTAGDTIYTPPDLRPPTFQFVGDVPAPLRIALLTVGVEATVAGGKAVVVARSNTPVPPEAAAVIRIADGAGTALTRGAPLRLPDGSSPNLDLEGATAGNGVAVAARGEVLLLVGPWAVATLERAGPCPTLTLSDAIVGPAAGLPRQAAFPVLIGRWCNRLVANPGPPAVVSASRAAADPLWTGPDGDPTGPVLPLGDAPPPPAPPGGTPDAVPARSPLRWSDAALAGALALLAIDSLSRSKRGAV